MKKAFFIFILQLIVFNCSNQQQIIVVPELDQHVFYPEQKSISFYRQKFPSLKKTLAISVVAVGDIMMGEHVIYYLDKYGAHYPFDSTSQYLNNADFAFGNLEAPFATKGVKFDKRFNFKVHPRYAKGLVKAGFNILNLANNHIMDYGADALFCTLNTLDTLGIKHCGAGQNVTFAGKPTILECDGIKVGFIGCSLTFPEEFWAKKDSAGTFYPHESQLVEFIKYSEEIANFTVVSFHWGQELRTTPKDYQRDFAHIAIDAGADLILGHHPHVLQGLEIYNNRLIIYSLGNFAFGSYSDKTKDSVILKTYLTSTGLLYARLIPISVHNREVSFQPRILKGENADSVIAHLNDISLHLNSKRKIIDNNGIIWGNLDKLIQY